MFDADFNKTVTKQTQSIIYFYPRSVADTLFHYRGKFGNL